MISPSVLCAAGRTEEAKKLVETFAGSEANKKRPYEIAEGFATIGDKERAFEWLEKSYQKRQANFVSVKIDPAFDSMQNDPRFSVLVQRVNFAK